MSSDGYADMTIGFKPVELVENFHSMQVNPREDVNFIGVLLGEGSDEDTQYTRELFTIFLNDYISTLVPGDRWKYDDPNDDVLAIWRDAVFTNYTEIDSAWFDNSVKEFFAKYKDVLENVIITEEITVDDFYMYKIENRKKNGKHYLVHSPATIKFENFTEFQKKL